MLWDRSSVPWGCFSDHIESPEWIEMAAHRIHDRANTWISGASFSKLRVGSLTIDIALDTYMPRGPGGRGFVCIHPTGILLYSRVNMSTANFIESFIGPSFAILWLSFMYVHSYITSTVFLTRYSLYGIFLSQVYFYCTTYRDHWSVRLLVFVLW